MKRITLIETADGARHETAAAAVRHLDAKYADGLLTLARELSAIDRYSETADYLDSHLPDFVRLSEIKADFQLVENDE